MAVDERQTTAASYIITFSNDIQNLNHAYAQHYNTALQVYEENRNNEEGIEENDKQALIQAGQILRYYMIRVYISYKSIVNNIDEWGEDLKELDKEIEGIYMEIAPQYLYKDFKRVEKYVQKMNDVLINTVIYRLLETSQDYFNALQNE